MRATNDLGRLNDAIAGRLSRLRRLFGIARGSTGVSSPDIAYIAIELDNLIISALRQFVISCLTGAKTATGDHIVTAPRLNDEGEVAAFVMSVLLPVVYADAGSPQRVSRKDEVKVREPRLIERVMASCAASNLLSVQAAYTYRTPVFTELPVLRNFYAHRNDDTWRKLKRRAPALGIYALPTPDDFLRARLPRRPVTVAEDWFDDVELFFYQLTY